MMLFLWPQLSAIKTEPLAQSDLDALKNAKTENRLLNPIYNTTDNKNRPMTITADEAIQNKSDQSSVTLVTPSATLKDNGNSTTLTANDGQYNQDDAIIHLQNKVVVQNSNETTLETEDLTADIKNGTAYSNSPAKLTTSNGVIEGQKITIENNGQKTIFQGPAKAVITNKP